MKNLSLIAIAFMAFFMTGCSNDNTTDVPEKTYLPTKMIFTSENSEPKITEFTYDKKNRLASVLTPQGNTEYTYDSNNHLLTKKHTEFGNQGETNITITSYTHLGSTVTASESRNGSTPLEHTIELNERGQIKKVRHENDLVMERDFSYSNEGNVSEYNFKLILDEVYSTTRTYSYDTKRHPFSMIKANQMIEGLLYKIPNEGPINNILTYTTTGSNNEQGIYEYEYNEAGFPIKITTKINGTITGTHTIEYTVK